MCVCVQSTPDPGHRLSPEAGDKKTESGSSSKQTVAISAGYALSTREPFLLALVVRKVFVIGNA